MHTAWRTRPTSTLVPRKVARHTSIYLHGGILLALVKTFHAAIDCIFFKDWRTYINPIISDQGDGDSVPYSEFPLFNNAHDVELQPIARVESSLCLLGNPRPKYTTAPVQEPSGRVFQLHQIKTTSTSTNFQVLLLMVGVPGSEVPLSSRWKVLMAFTLPNYASCINEAITLFGNVSLPVTKCLER